MVKIDYSILEFDHIVEFTSDRTIFAAARENGSGRIRLFLINELTGNVYARNGRVDSWEELTEEDDRIRILSRIAEARDNCIPVYRINGSHN